MNRIIAQVRMELLSDATFSSGNSIPGVADITLRIDSQGQPYMPGSTLKGLLREALGNYMSWTNTGTEQDLDELLGSSGIQPIESDRRLVFSDLHPEQQELREADCSYLRTFTKLKDGVVEHGTLHSAICLQKGLVLTGRIVCAQSDQKLIENGLHLIQLAGLKRTRGFGRVKFTLCTSEPIRPYGAVPAGNWIHYQLRLQTPMAITLGTNAPTDEDRKNYTDGNTCIPGSAIRGMVISHLARTEPEWFAANKETLLRQVVFRNALPMSGKHSQIPVPMGFYGSRDQSEIYNVLDKEVQPGHKRARLGRYCHLEGATLLHSSPAMESSLRITLMDPATRTILDAKKRQMFTVEAMAAGTVLEGWIHVPDPALVSHIADAFQTWLCIGADRFGGSGLCSVELLDDKSPDYSAFCYRPEDTVPDTLCMLIVSPTALMDGGEISSLTDEALARLLGVSEAKIDRCAASVTQQAGFNRTWGCATPTVSMYAPGSIFRIKCSEAPAPERLRELEETGIGIRRNEGCGQVLFLRDFSRIRSFCLVNEHGKARSSNPSALILRRRARCRWLLDQKIAGRLSDSQLGTLQSLCESIIAGTGSRSDLNQYFRSNLSRKTMSDTGHALLKTQLDIILATPLYKLFGCAPFADTEADRLQLFCDLIDLNRKEASR